MCFADRPPPLAPGIVGKPTLVAITTSSRHPARREPRISSDAPALYTSAVSKKSLPASRNAVTIAAASPASHPQPGVPKFIAPRHTRETERPDVPSFRGPLNLLRLGRRRLSRPDHITYDPSRSIAR